MKKYLIYIGIVIIIGLHLGIIKYTEYLKNKCDDRVKILELELNKKEYEIEENKKIISLMEYEINKLTRYNNDLINSNNTYLKVIENFSNHKH